VPPRFACPFPSHQCSPTGFFWKTYPREQEKMFAGKETRTGSSGSLAVWFDGIARETLTLRGGLVLGTARLLVPLFLLQIKLPILSTLSSSEIAL